MVKVKKIIAVKFLKLRDNSNNKSDNIVSALKGILEESVVKKE